jgi:ubiquitin C-terminal hydrolase
MNATLQCLCNIQKFVNYFKYNPHLIEIVKNDKEKLKLCSAFKLLIENLYPYQLSKNYKLFLSQNKTNQAIPNYTPKSYYAPKNFKETISRMNPLFEGIAANDAKDLVNFLLMTLHEELNKAKPNPNDNNNAFQDQTNKQIMFNTFGENFKKSYQSIISDLFYALNYNKTQCSNCNTISYNYQIYFFLIFPLEEVRKFKLANSSNGLNNTNIVDINDCFFFEQRVNYMMGENAMYCNYCKQTCGSAMSTFIATGPEILIIILNRGKGIQFNVKINFYLELDLSNFIELKNTGCYYELFGVITHIGKSGMEGHFIAYCKDMWTQQWLKFNDAIVSPVSNFKSEVIDFAMPYLLFYQKKH